MGGTGGAVGAGDRVLLHRWGTARLDAQQPATAGRPAAAAAGVPAGLPAAISVTQAVRVTQNRERAKQL